MNTQRRGLRLWIVTTWLAALIAACGGGSPETDDTTRPRSAPPGKQALAVRSPGANDLFDWAEKAYPAFFPSHQANQLAAPYIYRYYPETGNYLGLDGNSVAVLGPISGGTVLVVGQADDFACRVYPGDCASPTLAAAPTSQRVVAPAAARFAVTASGTPAPSYQWQLSTNGGASFANLSGATSSSYTTPATSVADDGQQYRVVVSNAAGSITSAAATLTVFPAIGSYGFTALGATMSTPRAMHTATLLADGRVLITGGFSTAAFPSPALNTAELYDPATNTFTPLVARMRSARTSHTATRLPDGRVLLAGGQADNNNGDGVASAELYDPVSRTFSSVTAPMASPRGGHAAVLLASGRVLLVGGYYQGAGTLRSDAELYDPATQTFTALAAKMVRLRESHRATLLPSGRVLITGGGDSRAGLDTAELYDPASQSFAALPARMTSVRAAPEATTLPGDVVLITGGATAFSPTGTVALKSAEVFDPTTQAFTSIAATMVTSRLGHAGVLLANGTVLLTGGGTASGASLTVLNTAELFKVLPPPVKPTVTLSAKPTTLVLGTPTTLTWAATAADTCVASGAWSGAKAVSGTQAITPTTLGLLTYSLSCTGAGGSTSASTTVQVQAAAPTVRLTATPTTAPAGSTITLNWSSTDATTCTASGAWSGDQATAGSQAAAAGAGPATLSYTLRCSGPGGTASTTATVSVSALACAQIGGTWTETARVTLTCIPADESDTTTATGTGTIAQSGCNISYTVAGIARTGTVSGYSFTMSGPAALAAPGATLTENLLTISGTISADARRITATGTGRLAGSAPGYSVSCDVSSSSTLTR